MSGQEREEMRADGYRWRFKEGKDRTWRYVERMPGFDPAIVESEPLVLAARAAQPVAGAEKRDCSTCQTALAHHSKLACKGCTGPDGTMRNWRPRYGTPAPAAVSQQPGRVPLSEDEAILCVGRAKAALEGYDFDPAFFTSDELRGLLSIARAIEAAHGIKGQPAGCGKEKQA